MLKLEKRYLPVDRTEILPGDGESDYRREPPDPEQDALRLKEILHKSRRSDGMRQLIEIMRKAGVDTETRDAIEEVLFVRYSSVQLRHRNTTPNGTLWTWKYHRRKWLGACYLPTYAGEWVEVRNRAEIPWLMAAVSTPQDRNWYRLADSEQLNPVRMKSIVDWCRATMKRVLGWNQHDYSMVCDYHGIYFRWKKQHPILQKVTRGRPAAEGGATQPAGTGADVGAGPQTSEQTETPPTPKPEPEPGADDPQPAPRRSTWPIW